MSARYDVAIVGGGHNALVCAGLLARRGLKVIALERRARLGGCAVTEEFHPGFKAPALAHTTFPLRPRVERELGVQLDTIAPEPRVLAPLPDGRALALHGDTERSAAAIRTFSPRDALRYPAFAAALSKIARLIARMIDRPPPDLDAPSPRDLFSLLRLGLGFRALGRGLAQDLLRFGPMPVADFAAEWFSSEPLQALIAARGIRGSFAGPWSAGTTAHLLLQAGADGGCAAGSTLLVRGGPGALAEALAGAARRHGAELRVGAEVASIVAADGRARGVALRSGEEIEARAVVSGADPRTTFLKLVEPAQLDPQDRDALRHYRQEGMASKVNLALGALPAFRATADMLRGRIHVGESVAALERAFDDAKHGGLSRVPHLEVTIPTLVDPSLAPEGRHVLSAYVQYTPRRLAQGSWAARRDELADLVLRRLEAYAPGLSSLVLAKQVLTPEDIETDYGIDGGHPLHGEPGLDQLFVLRPALGFSRYRAPIQGLYLCGAGTHPGGFLTGAPGANAAREILSDLKA